MPSRIVYLYDTSRASMDVTISSIDVRENFPPVITTQSLPQGKQNVYYETTITATGDLPLSWDIQGLPTALSYDHNASGDRVIISGIPAVSGSFDVTARVSNDVSSDTKIFLLVIVSDDDTDNIPITDEEFGALSKDLASPDVDNDPRDGKLDKKERDRVTTLPKDLGHTYPNYPMRYWPRGVGWPSGGYHHFRYLRELYISGGWVGSSWLGKGDGSGGGSGGGGGLDLSSNTDLEVLIIENVYLGRIDLSKNTKLKVLILINCGLTELDLSNNTQLEYLDCSYNYLTVLNLSVNISLKYLNCSYNYLTWINLQVNTSLQEVVCSPQEVTGNLEDSGNTTYPYSFDLRRLLAAERFTNIDASTITADVDVSPQNYVLRFRRVATRASYYYRVGIIANLFMQVNIKLTYNGTGEPVTPPSNPTTSIITTSITSGTASSNYGFTLSGQGTGTLTWAIISGSLPPGLTLNTNGTISGTPTASGTYSFTVRLSASGGGSATRTFTITIDSQDEPDNALIAPHITSRTLPEGTVSIGYTYQLTATGTLPLTWRISSGSLPPGLTMDTSGRITGTPTTAGTYRFTVRVENRVGYDELELVIIIRTATNTNITSNDGIPPDIIAMYTLRSGYVGVWYNVSIYAEGTRIISWRITEGSLPPGLRINSDGTISGTPTTAGEYTFTVEAVNNWGRDVAIFVINIYANNGQSGNSGDSGTDSDGTGIIYEYTRTINSLTEYELAMLPSDIYIIAAVMPRFRVTVSGTYRFVVNLYETVPTGLTLVWFPFQVNGSGGGTARFLDTRGAEIKVSPSTRRVVVSVYLEADTYAPVIAVLRPSEPESPDTKPNTNSGGGGGGGGCNSSSGALMLGLLATLPFFRKR